MNLSGNEIIIVSGQPASNIRTPSQEYITTQDISDLAVASMIGYNLLATGVGIDSTIAGATLIYNVPIGKRAIVTGAIIRNNAISGVSVVPVLGIGSNASYDDIFTSSPMTGLTTSSSVYVFTSFGIINSATSAAPIYLEIDTPATATQMVISVDLMGYLL